MKMKDEIRLSLIPFYHCGFCGNIYETVEQMKDHLRTEHKVKEWLWGIKKCLIK